jgi:crotonobetainyl-CoA:carnitine CoA-transferase CaiB-like acyl-CoA transferase
MLCHGIMVALVARERHGVGQRVDSSHLGAMAWMQGLSLSAKLMSGSAHGRMKREDSWNPLWNSYRCADDNWVCLAMIQADRYWADLCKAIEREDMIADERFVDLSARAQNGRACIAEMDAAFAKRPRSEWLERLKKQGDLIFTSVATVDELVTDPQMEANDYIVDFDHPTYGTIQQLGIPVALSETPGALRLPAPQHGQHTEEILTELLGYTWDDIGVLREKKVL